MGLVRFLAALQPVKMQFWLASIFLILIGSSTLVNGQEAVDEVHSKPYIFLFSGPPGSGRARLAVKIHSAFSIPLIASAALVMDHIHEDSPLGELAREQSANGGQFSNDYFFKALFERIGKGGCQDGFILDGIPRTVGEAESLYAKLSKTFNLMAFHIDVSDAWLVERVEERFVCPECGRVYHEEGSYEKNSGLCESCKSQLQRRAADDPEVLAEKLKAYRLEMDPILKFYAEQKILVQIKGNRSIDEMYDEMVRIIESKTKLKRAAIQI